MEIFQEPEVATMTTPSRPKAVSFGTPMRSGRKPLSAAKHNQIRGTPHVVKKKSGSLEKTPLNNTTVEKENQHSSNMGLFSPSVVAPLSLTPPTSAQSFRRALRGKSPHPTTTSPSIVDEMTKSAAALEHKDTGAPAPLASKGVSFAVSFKSNGDERAAAVEAGGNLLTKRTSLLGGAGRTSRLGGATALGPPQRVAPKTPNSLLRTELDGDYDDDFCDDMEESLLVSPPGALWNVLGASHNPSSAGSTTMTTTGLYIVPPHTAAAIHEISTSQKKKNTSSSRMEWASPPLQPRSLLQTTPESLEDHEDQLEERETVEEDEAEAIESPEPTILQTRRGVALDLSTMFSVEKNKPEARVFAKATPPPHLLERLQKPTKRSKATAVDDNSQPTRSKLSSKLPPKSVLGPPTKIKVLFPSHDAESRAGGTESSTMDSRTFKPAQLSPPPHLLERLQKPTASSLLEVKKTDEPPVAPAMEESEPIPPVEPMVKGKGLTMDMSNLFTDATNVSKNLATPPPHLLKRLEQRTAPKPTKSDSSKAASNAKPPKPVAVVKPPKSVDPAPVPRPNRAKKAETKQQRAPLQKNSKFFPKKEAKSQVEVVNVMDDSMGPRNTVAFEISAPTEKAVVVQKTPMKQKAPKAKSPIKIARDAEDWAGKQCDTFVSWLNYTFHPDDDEDGDTAGSSGLRALVIHRRLAQVRFKAAELFQSAPMKKMRDTVLSEIARGRLAIRADRDIHADLSLRKQAIQLLLSYTTPWLRLGLEVMFGELIMPDKFQDQGDGQMTPVARMRAALRAFVVDRVLSDSNVLMKYTKGKTKVPSGKFETLYREEMRTLVLYRLMVLILFLDHAKTANVLDKVPRLFTKGSEVKSSKAVLLSVCRHFLSAEGDFIKHLSRIGLKVSYVQDPIDELEFNVTNLAADLRDGGRLTRMAEIVTDSPFKVMMRSLRLPAVSRLQKMHNVNVSIDKLKEFGIWIPEDVSAHHIVDAHREIVLKLMWAVIAHACMTKLLESNQVEHEIENVLRSGQARRKMQGLLKSPQGLSPDKSTDGSQETPEEKLKSLLLRWCKAVLSNFGLQLHDFTDSFADGKALCFLVHYYHPAVIRAEEILPTSNDTTELPLEQALANERSNSALVAKRVTELGGIPKMLPVTDSKNPPDERSMLLCLTYLCSRLMESSEEIFATILIQACYRRYREKVLQEKKEAAAWVIYQYWCENKHTYYASLLRRYAAAVAVLENFVVCHRHGLVRMKRDRLEREERQHAAVEIQRFVRGGWGRQRYFVLWERQHAAVVIQKYFRRYEAQLDLLEAVVERDAATSIQTTWRAFQGRCLWHKARGAVIDVQKSWRGYLDRRELQRRNHAAILIQKTWWNWVEYADSQVAAILIQSRWRGVSARYRYQQFVAQHKAATTIQKVWRGYCKAIVFEITRELIISIQRAMRGYLVRKMLPMQRMSRAATLLQKTWRGFAAQVQFNLDVLDIVSVQSLARMRLAKKSAERRVHAIARMQLAMRCALARRVLHRLRLQHEYQIRQHNAAIVCQCAIRTWRAKNELSFRRTVNESSKSIQRTWRRFVARRGFLHKVSAITLMQASFRGRIARQRWRKTILCVTSIQRQWGSFAMWKLRHSSATCIQSFWRASLVKTQFQHALFSTTLIQSCWRRYSAVNEYRKTCLAVVVIQACWRRYFARYNFELDLLEIVICQSLVRRMLVQREACKRKASVQTLQNFARRWLSFKRLEFLRSQHEDYLQRQASAIAIQSSVRCFLARRCRSESVRGATVIAAFYRMVIHRRHFQSMRCAAVKIQAMCRGRELRLELMRLGLHVTTIQRIWRGFSRYIKYSVTLCDIVLAQSAVRRYLARRRTKKVESALLLLQSFARRHNACRRVAVIRKELEEERRRNQAAELIQAIFRGSTVRRELWWKHANATLIQSVYRTHVAKIFFELARYDVTVVQSLARVWHAKRQCLRRMKACVQIQSMARTWLARRMLYQLWCEQQREFLENSASAIVQATYRGYLIRRNLAVLHGSATSIQSAFRRHYWSVWYQMYVVDVTIVQCQVRRWIMQRKLHQALASVLVLQCSARRFLATRKVAHVRAKKLLWENQNLACLSVQRIWRGYASRKTSIRHFSARKIQKTWRCFAAHVEYLVKQIAVIRLQSEIRRFQARMHLRNCRSQVVKIQAALRGFLQRDYLRFVSLSASIVQSAIRRYIKRQAFLRMRDSAIRIQGLARGYLAREDLELNHFAASEIQRVWRGFVQFCDFFVHVDAAVRLQSFARKYLAMKNYEALKLAVFVERCFFNFRARAIQRSFRSYLHRKRLNQAAAVIQMTARVYIRRRRATIVNRGVTRLQAIFRAKQIRRYRTKKVAAVVSRLDVAHKKARKDPKLQIGYKTKHALLVLQTSKSLAEIMDAVKSLETSTRLSSLCCVLFIEANAARILLDLIRSCNRSVPHVELVHCILLTLENVSQYRKLVPSFADCSSAEVFLDKMQMFRDKDGIFCLSIELLQRIAECNPMVEEFCAMHEHIKRLKALHQLSLKRARPANGNAKRTTGNNLNRMKRREHFDRNAAIKSLGIITERFVSHSIMSPTNAAGKIQHFTF